MNSTQSVPKPYSQGPTLMNFLRYTAIATAVVLFGAGQALAASLSIGANNIVWNPAIDGTPSGTMSIEIFNSTVGPDPDLLGGWLLDLVIQPVAATGTLHFNSAALPPGASYVMNGNSTSLNGSVSNTSVVAFAAAPNSPFGVSVPASGKYLLDLNFKTPDDASGLFALVALPGIANTTWSDAEGNDREFTNIPWDSNSLILGYINVVPEPASVVTLAVGLVAVVSVGIRRRARRA
jgi:hypothetical protein